MAVVRKGEESEIGEMYLVAEVTGRTSSVLTS
jgi:hypothetical protein